MEAWRRHLFAAGGLLRYTLFEGQQEEQQGLPSVATLFVCAREHRALCGSVGSTRMQDLVDHLKAQHVAAEFTAAAEAEVCDPPEVSYTDPSVAIIPGGANICTIFM